jgi:RNA ligase (TIGR02306 family)
MTFTIDEIVSIKKVSVNSARYDITVENNHNFFANNILVHNCQNLVPEIEKNQGQVFEKSIKLDGSSMTVFHYDKATDKEGNTFTALGVCSRNLNLRENDTNTFWRVARKEKVIEALQFLGRNLAIQGELVGEGIQGNNENIKGHQFFIFNIFDIDKQEYLSPIERTNLIQHLNENGFNLKQVPILGYVTLNQSVQEILDMADGESLNAPNREGLVFKRIDGQFSFKAISNWYLEKFQNR